MPRYRHLVGAFVAGACEVTIVEPNMLIFTKKPADGTVIDPNDVFLQAQVDLRLDPLAEAHHHPVYDPALNGILNLEQ